MADCVALFKSLPLAEQTVSYLQITKAFEEAKEARRLQLEGEIRALGFKPGEASRKSVKVKYRGPNGETWSGVGAMASFLKKLKDAGEDIERYRVSS